MASRSRLLLLFFSIFSFFNRSLATSDYFLFPPYPGAQDAFQYNPTYTVGSKLNLWWKTDYSSIKLVLWQVAATEVTADGTYPSKTLFDDHAPIESMQWTVDVSDFNTVAGTVFFFSVYNAAFTNQSFTCHYFNVTSMGTITTQSVVTALVPSSGAVTATVTPQVAYSSGALLAYPTQTSSSMSTSKTSSSTGTSKPDPGLSDGAKTGIGVGVGVGVAGILAGAALGWYILRRNKKARDLGATPGDQQQQMEHYASPNPKYSPTYAYQYAPLDNNAPPTELEGAHGPSELPDEGVQKPRELAGSDVDR